MIRLLSPLPDITANGVMIEGEIDERGTWPLPNHYRPILDGSALNAADGLRTNASGIVIRYITIINFPGHGILIDGGTGNTAERCNIGFNEGDAAPNGLNGIGIRGGSSHVVKECWIGGNLRNGIHANESTALSIDGTVVGLAASEQRSAIGNAAHGVSIFNGSGEITQSTVVGNRLDGIIVTGAMSRFSVAPSTTIHSNGGLSIDLNDDGVSPNDDGDLDEGPNLMQNYPSFEAFINDGILTFQGYVESTPSTEVRLSFYEGTVGPGGVLQAERSLGSDFVETDLSGRATFRIGLRELTFDSPRGPPQVGKFVTAVATAFPVDGPGMSSELHPGAAIGARDVVYKVSTTVDSGPGSLRQALYAVDTDGCSAGVPCRIEFAIPPPVPASGYFTIELHSPLPPITRSGITIDGRSQRASTGDTNPRGPEIELRGDGSTPGPGLAIHSPVGELRYTFIRSVAINGFVGAGIAVTADKVSGATFRHVRIDGCVIGADPSATRRVPNRGSGIVVDGGQLIIGQAAYNNWPESQGDPLPNVISGNIDHGIVIESGSILAIRNFIGTDWSGELPLGNRRSGVAAAAGTEGEVGGGVIAFNRGSGLRLSEESDLTLFHHSYTTEIRWNGGLGIDLGVEGSGRTADSSDPAIMIRDAYYDPSTGKTNVQVDLDPASGNSVTFWKNRFPDPSGFGEGEAAVPFARSSNEIAENLSGYWLTAAAREIDWYNTTTLPNTEFSNAFYIVEPGCPSPPTLRPIGNDELSRSVALDWEDVTGAIEYRVWIVEADTIPHVVGSTNVSHHALQLPPGDYVWHVETIVSGCRPFVSAGSTFVIETQRRRPLTRP
ncbi:MAG: right-handed parallel beta-helix repeat-containing protein [Acidobacteria bacterium]|nr:right-handed parallel beta-helix repeat-containing protein [Acidobacteriota bacterium]